MQKPAGTENTEICGKPTLSRDWSVSAIAAGFLAVLISYSGPAVIFFQAADVAHVSGDMIASWIWGISIGAAVSGTSDTWEVDLTDSSTGHTVYTIMKLEGNRLTPGKSTSGHDGSSASARRDTLEDDSSFNVLTRQ